MAIYRLYIGISNPSNADVYFFINNQQYTNPFSISYHDVVAFTVPIILTFIQIRYPAENLFQTHPITIVLVLLSLLAYCLSSIGFRMHISQSHDVDSARSAGVRNWSSRGMTFFGFVSVLLLTALLFPVIISWICPLLLLVLPALFGFVLLLVILLLVVVKFVRALKSRRRRLPLLPLTSA